MTIYIKIGQYEEALKIADDNYNYEPIQNQLITLYMRMGKYDEAEKEAQKHLDCDPNQSQLMTIYIEQKKYDEAIKIGEKNPDNEIMQYKLMSAYINVGEYEKAKLIAKKYPKNEQIQNQLKNIKENNNIIKTNVISEISEEKNEKESEEKKLLKQKSDKKIIPVKKEVKIVTKFKNKKSNLLISKKVEKNNNSKCKTTYDLLDKKYKEDVFNLKAKYYFDMNNSEKRASAIYKYDRLEDILSSKPSKKNLELLLLMLVGDMSVDIQKDYQHEYSKIMKRIETKRDELKNNTTL